MNLGLLGRTGGRFMFKISFVDESGVRRTFNVVDRLELVIGDALFELGEGRLRNSLDVRTLSDLEIRPLGSTHIVLRVDGRLGIFNYLISADKMFEDVEDFSVVEVLRE